MNIVANCVMTFRRESIVVAFTDVPMRMQRLGALTTPHPDRGGENCYYAHGKEELRKPGEAKGGGR